MTDLDTDGTTSRRAVLRGAAVGGLALPLLAACGSSSDDAGSSSSPAAGSGSSDGSASPDGGSSGGTSGGSSGGGTTVAAADVPVGGGIVVTADKVVVTQPTKGTFHAFSAICTHLRCAVATVADGQIICPCHGSHFSIQDGAPVAGPAQAPLASKKVSVSGGQISVT